MKLHVLGDDLDKSAVGNKAAYLSYMKKSGFNVPNGFVLDSSAFDTALEESGQREKINAVLSSLEPSSCKEASQKLSELTGGLELPKDIIVKISESIDISKKYAVRSSGIKEDLNGFSFAGQYSTFINVSGAENIARAAADCCRSVYSETVLSYLASNSISAEELKMSVIIEEMVNSEISGVAFTVNPVSGNDKEIVIEAAQGQGELLVSGKVCAQRYGYDWFNGARTFSDGELLDEAAVIEIADAALKIQMLFGYPCDIEFAYEGGRLYILQARAITKIMYGGINAQWTTADFKDGGVSATVCTPYMWSLYEYIWESEFRGFLIDAKILKASQMKKLGDMFYGRPYWNLSVAKAAMSKVPGYKERDFDNELGVRVTYDGDGVTTSITTATVFGIAVMALQQKKIVSERRKNAQSLKDGLLEKYNSYRSRADGAFTSEEIRSDWKQLVFDDYLSTEGTYFRQIFINTIHQSLFKDKILKHTSSGGYFRLIGGLDNVSHLLPFYNIWSISRDIRNDSSALSFWTDTPVDELKRLLDSGSCEYGMDKLRAHIESFGYHSKKELDVTYPCYYEDTLTVISELKDTVALGEECSPDADREALKKSFEAELAQIKAKSSSGAYKKLEKNVTDMREMLWWREEFRDVSTRFYYIIRIYTILLAKQLVKEKIFSCEDDIWFTKIADVKALLDGKLDGDGLAAIIERNKKYYASFRNFMSENEIGHVFDGKASDKKRGALCGVGCNNGVITGTARVIASIDETDRLKVGDILVTKFTDTGWTSKFAILSGIVTEFGGILCHAAIVSREYGIPCVVCAENATHIIQDGSTITINGETGEIILSDKGD